MLSAVVKLPLGKKLSVLAILSRKKSESAGRLFSGGLYPLAKKPTQSSRLGVAYTNELR